MAGHSKWANIKHKKAREDAKRGKVFTRLIRELTVAARHGGSDADANPRLRLAIAKAQAENLAKETMERAIKRGAGELDDVQMEETRFEGYAPGGVAVMVDCLSDNNKRTVSEVRHAFSKGGGNLGTSGSVAFQFKEQGVLSFVNAQDTDALMEAALEAGADDIVFTGDHAEIITQPSRYAAVHDALQASGYTADESEVTMRAETLITLAPDEAEKVMGLIERLEALDDVQSVVTNADFPEDAGN